MLVPALSLAFNVGFNQAWLKNNYEHQWTGADYSPSETRRILDLTSHAGGETLRLWLFEGQNSTSLIWKAEKVSGLHPDFLKNLEDFIKAARERNIKVYLTLFDGNLLRTLQNGPFRNRWWNILNNKFGARAAFQQNALNPLLEFLYRDDIRPWVFGLDVMNEIDAAVAGWEFEGGWKGANNFVCDFKNRIHSQRQSQLSIPVTASIGWPAIPFYSKGAQNLILDPNPHPSCVDFWDIHFYNNEGKIPNCEKIKQVSKKYKKKIYLGEFGQQSKQFSDSLQLLSTREFIKNAKACGLSGALAWRLSDIRPEANPEARFSYEAYGVTRPAYQWIKEWNLLQESN